MESNKMENTDDTQKIMKTIEQNAEKEVIQSRANGTLDSEKLVSIMSKGAEDFKNNTGRNMTYAEMRAMFG